MRHRAKKSLRYGLVVWLTVLVAGCATPERPEQATHERPPARLWQAHHALATRTTAWTLDGKLAVTHGGKHWLLQFKWKQANQSYDIDIFSVFGHVANFTGRADKVELRRQGRVLVAATPEEAAQRLLGFPAPISLMRHWVLGIPSPHQEIDALAFDRRGLAQTIVQGGWRVEYASYHKVDADGERWMPRELTVSRIEIGEANATTKLTAWTSQWSNVK